MVPDLGKERGEKCFEQLVADCEDQQEKFTAMHKKLLRPHAENLETLGLDKG